MESVFKSLSGFKKNKKPHKNKNKKENKNNLKTKPNQTKAKKQKTCRIAYQSLCLQLNKVLIFPAATKAVTTPSNLHAYSLQLQNVHSDILLNIGSLKRGDHFPLLDQKGRK